MAREFPVLVRYPGRESGDELVVKAWPVPLRFVKNFDPGELRDEHGEWTVGGKITHVANLAEPLLRALGTDRNKVLVRGTRSPLDEKLQGATYQTGPQGGGGYRGTGRIELTASEARELVDRVRPLVNHPDIEVSSPAERIVTGKGGLHPVKRG